MKAMYVGYIIEVLGSCLIILILTVLGENV
jgi:hypothetical protein